MASRRNNAVLMEDNRRELNLLWEQGIKPLRDDVKEIKANAEAREQTLRTEMKEFAGRISSFQRWIVGLILSLIPAYIAAFVAILKK
jgi:hypothetical protein